MGKKTINFPVLIGLIIPFALFIIYNISFRLTDNFTAANYITVLAYLFMLLNRRATYVGNLFILLVFSFSWLYGGYFMDRISDAKAADIVYCIIIAIFNIISLIIGSADKKSDKKGQDDRDVIHSLAYISAAIAALRLLFIF